MAKRPREQAVYFLDRCVDHDDIFAALVEVGALVERHRNHFADSCPDEVWLREVGSRGWAVLTRDRMIRRREVETKAWQEGQAAVFDLTGKTRLRELGSVIARSLPKMERVLSNHNRPLWATVSAAGVVTVVEGQRVGGIKRDR